MKYILILILSFVGYGAYAWSCDLTVFDDVSSVDRCYGRILDHWIHEAKVSAIQTWQYARNQNNGTLKKAGTIWRDQSVRLSLSDVQRLTDLKDHLVRDRIHASFPSTLTCESDDD